MPAVHHDLTPKKNKHHVAIHEVFKLPFQKWGTPIWWVLELCLSFFAKSKKNFCRQSYI